MITRSFIDPSTRAVFLKRKAAFVLPMAASGEERPVPLPLVDVRFRAAIFRTSEISGFGSGCVKTQRALCE
jgi:hypothetical protein